MRIHVHFPQTIVNSTSTITYDVLIRAGIETTSAYVPEANEDVTRPPVAECSRGINIMPDMYLDIESRKTVSPSLHLKVFS